MQRQGYLNPIHKNEQFLQDGAYFPATGRGWAGDPNGVMINMGGGRRQTWTDDRRLTYQAGAYPYEYYHCVTRNDHNPFF